MFVYMFFIFVGSIFHKFQLHFYSLSHLQKLWGINERQNKTAEKERTKNDLCIKAVPSVISLRFVRQLKTLE